MVDQPDRQLNTVTARGPRQAVTSLNREFQSVLVSEEAAGIGRAVAQIVRGDGWHEAKASAVLTEALVVWLGSEAVRPIGFFANGTGPVEIVAKVGHYFVTGHGIENEDDLTVNVLPAPPGQVQPVAPRGPGHLDPRTPVSRWAVRWHSAPRDRLGALLAEEIDPEIARVVLGA